MQRTVVLNVVGLTRALIGERTPNIQKLAAHSTTIKPVTPAVTCSAQATYLTGKQPSEHGIVANGWYFRDQNEVWLWRQSNKLIQAPKIWDIARARNKDFTCSNTFWWYAMATEADYTLTPRPLYLADGRKLPDCYTYPLELREKLTEEFGTFPLFNFWGPMTSIKSSRWIADAAMYMEREHQPSLQLVYLPHLDYCLQKFGPDGDIDKDLKEIDDLVGELIDYFSARDCQIIILSEYGIGPVNRPVHPNRILREAGKLSLKVDLGREYLDFHTCRAFAMSDHQIAHIYVQEHTDIAEIKALFQATPGVAKVLEGAERAEYGLDHERAGELILLAEPDSWFTYYYWQDKDRAPDYAHQVEIHKKPGFDPCEMFLNPELKLPKLKVAQRLLQKKLGFRYVLDVISTDATQIKGSHGVWDGSDYTTPVFISSNPALVPEQQIHATDVCDLILRHVFSEPQDGDTT
ncbi:alkaline phosphatase family protein [Gilvimarinus algae]|uniref:Alkaline phosphatase family protein n=1 Tax=Gilvimarinus algae TaxID=3058037 RepID=A0ABT8THB3_9GAMM|nr:nucleotide pyrophosphatase/phosphodiesterase family protein [Gilvimarinus sp. SDUM040014]MDO3383489.1 alkaline phosphatase family protein [Gilvimarinus sp. SDUM040014]